MKKIVAAICLIAAIYFAACKTETGAPNVSEIEVEVKVRRFDRDFFQADTNHLNQSLDQLYQQYPNFFPGYVSHVLGINPNDAMATEAIKNFIRSYRSVFDTANKMAENELPEFQKSLTKGLQYWKHYFPGHQIDSPFIITTFIGPMDAFEPFPLGDYGDVRTNTGVGVALQFHLGPEASIYAEGERAGVFYDYQTRRFTPEMMLVNAMKNIIIDAFPYQPQSNNLVEEMIEKGKRLYVLDKVLPTVADSLKLGYTARQMEGCYENEALIWNYFVKNDLLYSKEAAIMQNYIKDGPKTAEIGEGAPGYIGLFTGLQIVRSYMSANGQISLQQLMDTGNQEILNKAGYKP